MLAQNWEFLSLEHFNCRQLEVELKNYLFLVGQCIYNDFKGLHTHYSLLCNAM